MCLFVTKTDGVDLWLESLCRFFPRIMLTQPLLTHLLFSSHSVARRQQSSHDLTRYVVPRRFFHSVIRPLFTNNNTNKCFFVVLSNLKSQNNNISNKTIP